MLSYGHIKNRTIIVDWLVKKDKRALELENENTNVKPIPGSWNTVFLSRSGTFSLSQMSNDELAQSLPWRENEG